MDRQDWDDLRYLLAVAQQGSAAAAARVLGVTHHTVLRRVQAAEEHYAVRVFERRGSGCVPTIEGAQLLAAAAAVDGTVTDLRRRLAGHADGLHWVLRLTTTDTLAMLLLAPSLARFRAQHPALQIELLLTNAVLDLHKLDADVTVRASPSPPSTLVGVRIGALAFARYASASFGDAHDAPWLVLDAARQRSPVGDWLSRSIDPARIALRANSFVALCRAAEAGLRVAVLPCFLGDRRAALRRLGEPIAEAATELWVLTHADLRRSPRVRALMGHLAGGPRRQRQLLAGRSA